MFVDTIRLERVILPLPARIICIALFCSNVGSFMVMPILAVYFATTRGYSATETGIILGVYFAAARITPLFIGALSDRFGSYKFIFWGLICRAIGFGCLVLEATPSQSLLIVTLVGLGGAAFETSSFAIFQSLEAKQREKSIILANLALNVGVIIGPIVGSIIAYSGSVETQFIGAFIFFLLTAIGVGISPRLRMGTSRSGNAVSIAQEPFRDLRFRLLLLTMLPWFVLFSQLFVTMPFAVSRLADNIEWSNSVFVVNGVVGIVFLSVVSLIFQKIDPGKVIVFCYFIGAAAFALALIATDVKTFLLSVALFSIAEVIILPCAEILVARYAPAGRGGAYFGAFNATFGIGGAIGHLMGSHLGLEVSLSVNWFAMMSIAILGGLVAVFTHLVRINPSKKGNRL